MEPAVSRLYCLSASHHTADLLHLCHTSFIRYFSSTTSLPIPPAVSCLWVPHVSDPDSWVLFLLHLLGTTHCIRAWITFTTWNIAWNTSALDFSPLRPALQVAPHCRIPLPRFAPASACVLFRRRRPGFRLFCLAVASFSPFSPLNRLFGNTAPLLHTSLVGIWVHLGGSGFLWILRCTCLLDSPATDSR